MILSAKVILDESLTDNDVAQENFFLISSKRHTSADSDDKSQSDLGEAGSEACCYTCSADFPHIWHIRQNDIVLSDYSCGIAILIPACLAINFAFIFPKLIKGGLYAVCFHAQSTYEGDLEATAIARRRGSCTICALLLSVL